MSTLIQKVIKRMKYVAHPVGSLLHGTSEHIHGKDGLGGATTHIRLKKEIQDFRMADCIILTTAKLENAKVLTGDVHFKNFSETIFLD